MADSVYRISRRQFLSMMAAGAGALALSSCGVPAGGLATGTTPGAGATSKVKLLTAGWPIDVPFVNATPGFKLATTRPSRPGWT